MAGSNALNWAIARSKLPPNLKLTMFALALVADADEGFGNIYFSKRKIAELTSRTERIAAEDVSDLVRFGALLVLQEGGGRRRSTRYQVIWERVVGWSTEDTEKLAQIRRFRRERVPKMRKSKPRSVQQGISRTADLKNPDPYIQETLIRTSEKPCCTDQEIRTTNDLKLESTVAEPGERSVHAVENSAGLSADSPSGGARPLMPYSDNPYHAVKPGETRHRGDKLNEPYIMRTSQNVEENANSTNSALFHILAERGRKLLAGYGLGEILWAEVRSDLKLCANRLGQADRADDDFLNRLEESLRAQRAHFLASQRGNPAPPSEKSPVRPANEAEL